MTTILIVDDSAFMRKMITQMIKTDPSFKIVGIARNGKDAIEQAKKLKPDIITLDIEMPIMDGLTALSKIKSTCRDFNPHVLMCSSLTVASSDEALKALRIGASDIIAKDPAIVGKGDLGFQKELLMKLRGLSSAKSTPSTSSPKKSLPNKPAPTNNNAKTNTSVPTEFEIDPSTIDAVVIGSSTGGPPVLENILSQITADLPVPIIIAQHMPELFTRSLTKRLDGICPCGAAIAESGVILDRPGVYVALGGQHLKLTRVAGKRIIARSVDEHPGAIYKPSVDLLFGTAAEVYGSRVLAIQLTGMGEDGKDGAKSIRDAGGQVITQEASTCVVYGMPKAIVESGFSSAALTPAQIQGVLMNLSTGKSGSPPKSGQSNEQFPPKMSA